MLRVIVLVQEFCNQRIEHSITLPARADQITHLRLLGKEGILHRLPNDLKCNFIKT